jgi:hypothetical protein
MESFVSWLRMLKSKHNMYGCIMSIEYGKVWCEKKKKMSWNDGLVRW